MRIYLDTCCLNRPFDDQAHDRIRLETEAVRLVLRRIEATDWIWVTSEVVRYELAGMASVERREAIGQWFSWASFEIALDDRIIRRAAEWQSAGLRRLDAFHVACAEAGDADVLLTTDDQFARRASRSTLQSRTLVDNPVRWLARQEESG